MSTNLHQETVAGFGFEWEHFDQSGLATCERDTLFARYFELFPWHTLPRDAEGLDIGCGSGRWARCVAPRVGRLHCIDASENALLVAERNLRDLPNCVLHLASVDSIPVEPGSMDFAYSLGVLHHVPDPAAAMRACVSRLKYGAPFLVYLYYAFDNRPAWYRLLWKATDSVRRAVSKCPARIRFALSQMIAAAVYLPLARTARAAEKLGIDVANWPLAAYRHRSFYVMRNDALDRFGTELERRFTRVEVEALMIQAGLTSVRVSEKEPYWCAVAFRR